MAGMDSANRSQDYVDSFQRDLCRMPIVIVEKDNDRNAEDFQLDAVDERGRKCLSFLLYYYPRNTPNTRY